MRFHYIMSSFKWLKNWYGVSLYIQYEISKNIQTTANALYQVSTIWVAGCMCLYEKTREWPLSIVNKLTQSHKNILLCIQVTGCLCSSMIIYEHTYTSHTDTIYNVIDNRNKTNQELYVYVYVIKYTVDKYIHIYIK